MATAADWYWKANDTAPAIEGQLTDSSGSPVDVTGASVTFIMKAVGGNTPKINAAATIVTAASGIVKYTPATGDTDTAGDYLAEFQVIFGDGSKETFPNPAYLAVTITADLDDA